MEEADFKGFFDDMTDGSMPRDPRMLLDRIVRAEEMEISLYYELARSAPNEQLRRVIEHMAGEEKQDLEKLRMLYDYFPSYGGKIPPGYSSSFSDPAHLYQSWSEKAKKARDIELHQCAMLCHLAMHAPYPCIQKIIIDLAGQQLRQAMFWEDMVLAYSGMAAGYPGGPGYTPGMYAEQEEKGGPESSP
jgi:hypothetical protein